MKITRTIGAFQTVNGIRYTLERIAENGREVWEGGVVGGTVFSTVKGEPGHPAYTFDGGDAHARRQSRPFHQAATRKQEQARERYLQHRRAVDLYEAALAQTGPVLFVEGA